MSDWSRRDLLASGAGLAALAAFSGTVSARERFPVQLSEAEWRKRLSPAAFAVLRHEATERAGTSPLDHEKRRGTFHCAGCNQPVFRSETKFDSGTGWPSFWAPIRGATATRTDRKLIIARTEVHCRRCGGHLGHIFNDGPRPTGKRYCINGVALKFQPA